MLHTPLRELTVYYVGRSINYLCTYRGGGVEVNYLIHFHCVYHVKRGEGEGSRSM